MAVIDTGWGRRAVASVAAVVVLASGCAATASRSTTGAASPAPAPGAPPPGGVAAPSSGSAQKMYDIRFVNLLADAAHPQGATIDIYLDGIPGAKPAFSVGYGQVSEYRKIPVTGFKVGVSGAAPDINGIPGIGLPTSETRATEIIGADSDGGVTGGELSESDGQVVTTSANTGKTGPLVPPPGQAYIVANATGVGAQGKDAGFVVGQVGAGCLPAPAVNDQTPTQNMAAGDIFTAWQVPAGRVSLGVYDPNDCATPVWGTVDLAPAAGQTIYLFPYGTGPTDRRMLALPLDDTGAGTAPTRAGPFAAPTTITAP